MLVANGDIKVKPGGELPLTGKEEDSTLAVSAAMQRIPTTNTTVILFKRNTNHL